MHCSNCGADINATMRFCTSCGEMLNQAGFGTSQDRRGQTSTTSKTKRFSCSAESYDVLVEKVQNWLAGQHFLVQKLTTSDGKQVIQAQKDGLWRKAVGMATATNIVMAQHDSKVTVEIGSGQWLDKAAGGLLGTIINPLFLVPAGFGAWEQWQLPDRIFAYIDSLEGELI